MTRKSRERINHTITHIFFILLSLVIAFPIFWLISSSFETINGAYSLPPELIPTPFSLQGWISDFQHFAILDFVRNSLGVATISTCLVLLITVFSGYSLARFAFKGRIIAYNLLLLTQFVPTVANILTLYVLFAHLHLINTWGCLIILYTSGGCVLGTLLFSGFFRGLPINLEESAMIDGSSRLGAFIRVLLPLMIPAIITVTIFSFTGFYGEVQAAHIFTYSSGAETLPVITLDLESAQGLNNLPALYAAGVLMSIPPLALFIAFQKYFNPTLATGQFKN